MNNNIMILMLWTSTFSISHVALSQEVFTSKKIKIGKFKYTLGISENYFFYEDNIRVINFDLHFKNKHQIIGIKLTYREPNSSANYNFKIDESHPPDIRASYKDGIILSFGEITINFEQKSIILIEKIVHKDDRKEPDERISTFIQMKNGLFKCIKTIENTDGKKFVIFEK